MEEARDGGGGAFTSLHAGEVAAADGCREGSCKGTKAASRHLLDAASNSSNASSQVLLDLRLCITLDVFALSCNDDRRVEAGSAGVGKWQHGRGVDDKTAEALRPLTLDLGLGTCVYVPRVLWHEQLPLLHTRCLP